jgi:hypothetical protein
VPNRRWLSPCPCPVVSKSERHNARTTILTGNSWCGPVSRMLSTGGLRRPISAETLRKQLRVGAKISRTLVAVVRAENAPAEHAQSGAPTTENRVQPVPEPLVKSSLLGLSDGVE